ERIPSVWNGKQFQARELVERGSLLSDEGNPHAFRLGRMSKLIIELEDYDESLAKSLETLADTCEFEELFGLVAQIDQL
ncbi:MAG: hypothetical protein J7540_00790, partial [Roseofilum sp. SID2]